MRVALLSLLVLFTAASAAPATPQGFYRQPAVSADRVVFVSQGDLWQVGRSGGAATRLTSHPGQEAWPLLLADGAALAFVAQIDGPGDVYTLPLAGGPVTRRTWLVSAQLRLWAADAQGRLLITAAALDGRPQTQIFRLEGDNLQVLPVADASDAALLADGRTLVFSRQGLRGDNAKAYRGGAMARLWVMDLDGNTEARPLFAKAEANERRPMPYRDAAGRERIAFLSDRNGFMNVWSAAADGSGLREHSRWRDFDLRHASLNGSTVLAARGADLVPISLERDNPEPQPLPITLAGEAGGTTTRWLGKPQDFLGPLAVSPNGERLALELRGRLLTAGPQTARRVQLRQSADAASRCREPAFSAEGRSVFAFCDFSGEQEIWQLDALGLAEPKRITQGGQLRRLQLAVSPDGRHLAHTDLGGTLYLTDLKSEGGPKTRAIDQAGRRGSLDELSWHPDGQALVYRSGVAQPAFRSQLWLYQLAENRKLALTSERYDSGSAAFSPDGQWLYFASRRHFQLQAGSSVWADRNMGPAFEPGEKLYALALQPGLRLPTQPRDELRQNDTPAKKDGAKLPAVQLAGLIERLHELPLPPGRYRELATDGKRLWWLDGNPGSAAALRSAALEPDPKPDTHSERVRSFQLSANGKTLLIQREAGPGAPAELLLIEAGPKLPADLSKATVRWADAALPLNPRDEWQQLFADAWRMQRDHFYDPGLHGVDWLASRRRHEPLLARVGDRVELAELMGQMASDLKLLHSQVGVGDLPPLAEPPPPVAGLGAQLLPHPQGARIERLYRGDPELVAERGPLLQPGVDVQEGDVITTINGRPLTGAMRWPAGSVLLQGEAGRPVRLGLLSRDGSRRELLVTAHNPQREQQLRYQDWRWQRAERVARAGQGRVGYLHLRAMGPEDIADFARDFHAQLDKEALIVDVRFNNGGSIDSWVLERLLRRAWGGWFARHPEGGPAIPNMQQSFNGPLAMLINEQSYSDGETIAEGFRALKLGTLIGKTTSGAGVWLSDSNRLADNGIMRAAELGQFGPGGSWIVEGTGVRPDVEVDNPPRATALGGDAQLDAAVARLLAQLPATRPAAPRPAAYPRP